MPGLATPAPHAGAPCPRSSGWHVRAEDPEKLLSHPSGDAGSWVLGKDVEEEQKSITEHPVLVSGKVELRLIRGLQDRLWAYPGGSGEGAAGRFG